MTDNQKKYRQQINRIKNMIKRSFSEEMTFERTREQQPIRVTQKRLDLLSKVTPEVMKSYIEYTNAGHTTPLNQYIARHKKEDIYQPHPRVKHDEEYIRKGHTQAQADASRRNLEKARKAPRTESQKQASIQNLAKARQAKAEKKLQQPTEPTEKLKSTQPKPKQPRQRTEKQKQASIQNLVKAREAKAQKKLQQQPTPPVEQPTVERSVPEQPKPQPKHKQPKAQPTQPVVTEPQPQQVPQEQPQQETQEEPDEEGYIPSESERIILVLEDILESVSGFIGLAEELVATLHETIDTDGQDVVASRLKSSREEVISRASRLAVIPLWYKDEATEIGLRILDIIKGGEHGLVEHMTYTARAREDSTSVSHFTFQTERENSNL